MAFFQRGLRMAAAQLLRAPIVCGPCLRQRATAAPTSSTVLKLVRAARSYATTQSQSPLGALSSNISRSAKSIPESAQRAAKSSSPETNAKVVGYWLIGSAASVFGIVVFGGLTRLTESGCVGCCN